MVVKCANFGGIHQYPMQYRGEISRIPEVLVYDQDFTFQLNPYGRDSKKTGFPFGNPVFNIHFRIELTFSRFDFFEIFLPPVFNPDDVIHIIQGRNEKKRQESSKAQSKDDSP